MKRIDVDFPDTCINIDDYRIAILHLSHEPPRRPWNIETHSHNSYEIHYITSGTGLLHTEQGEHLLTAGTMYITGPDVRHGQTSGTDNPMEEYCINIAITHTQRRERHSETGRLIELIESNPFAVRPYDFDAAASIGRMLQIAGQRRSAWLDQIGHCLISLLIDTARCLEEQPAGMTVSKQPISRTRTLDQYLRNTQIKQNPDQLASRLCVGRRQLRRIVKQQYGMTLNEKITAVRLENACQLLRDGTIGIADVAQRCGFGSASYFSHCFKKHYGVSPLAYRRNHKNKELPHVDV
ncbi:MAG: AraC family transcriptional regulator [Clostridia bacterium]|nr:AraC family transcriptional regulator [Clostridia bacterium]